MAGEIQLNHASYHRGKTRFHAVPGQTFFRHNLAQDYHLFIFWEKGGSYWNELLSLIEANFSVIATGTVEWQSKYFKENLVRLYQWPTVTTAKQKQAETGKGEFLYVLIEDKNYEYRYVPNMSGIVRLVNKRVMAVKCKARHLVGGNLVHSTDTPDEFYYQASLLFGSALLNEILANPSHNQEIKLTDNLAGYDGWATFTSLFESLNYCSNYLVLRNYDSLPVSMGDSGDVDLLCDNICDFIAASNAEIASLSAGGAKLNIRVAQQVVPFDVRFIGDGYFDPKWQRDMLERKVLHLGIVFVPRLDDSFFSLLYHAALQKPAVGPDYQLTLTKIATNMGLDFIKPDAWEDERSVARLIDGFLLGQGYRYTKPLDHHVLVNQNVLKHLTPRPEPYKVGAITQHIVRFVPRWIRHLIPKRIRMLVEKCL